MYVAEIHFASASPSDPAVLDAVTALIAAWRKNGQVLGLEFPVAHERTGLRATLSIPENDALAAGHENAYVRDARAGLAAVGAGEPEILSVSPDAFAVAECPGHRDAALILFTDFVSAESPLRCAECFGTVPLYQVPHISGGEYLDVVSWQADYRACDRLQMSGATGEAFALHEMGDAGSSLSRRGRAICAGIEAGTGRRAYYYLYRYYGRDAAAERERRCPGCGGEWLLSAHWHHTFDFRCDRCRLLSNLAPSLTVDEALP